MNVYDERKMTLLQGYLGYGDEHTHKEDRWMWEGYSSIKEDEGPKKIPDWYRFKEFREDLYYRGGR